jgi:hypothetical protein
MDKRVVKRRDFLKVSAAAVLGTAATACAAKEKIVTQIVTQEVEKIVQQTVEVEKEVEKVVESTKIVEVEKQVEKEVQVTVEVPRAWLIILQGQGSRRRAASLEERLPQNPVVSDGCHGVRREVRTILNGQQWFKAPMI